MKENPDNKDYHGLAASSDNPYLVAQQGALRFVEKEVDNHGTPARARILQRFEWSCGEAKFDWYDIPLVIDE
jgi:hypothetical protein